MQKDTGYQFLHMPLPRGGEESKGAQGGVSTLKTKNVLLARNICQRRVVTMLKVAATF